MLRLAMGFEEEGWVGRGVSFLANDRPPLALIRCAGAGQTISIGRSRQDAPKPFDMTMAVAPSPLMGRGAVWLGATESEANGLVPHHGITSVPSRRGELQS